MLGSNFDLSKEIAKIAEARERASRPIKLATPLDTEAAPEPRRPDRVDTAFAHDEMRDIRPSGLGYYLSQLT